MKRRQFLRAAGAAAVVATWPRWLANAFADQECDAKKSPAQTGLAALSGAWTRAQTRGKPLLVLVIPEDGGEKYRRGHALGELLNHGAADQVAPLALVEVACATMADLKRLVPSAGEGEPLMVLVDTDRVPAHAARLDASFPELPPSGWLVEEDGAKPADPNVVIEERIAILARLLRGAIAPDASTVSRRAALTRKKLTLDERGRLDAFVARDGWIPTELVDRGAAVLLDAAGARQLDETRALGLLRDAVRARLVVEPPAGAHWATSAGCGVDVEETAAERKQREEEEKQGVFNRTYVVVGCGMGHTPEKSQRFLYFFAKGEVW